MRGGETLLAMRVQKNNFIFQKINYTGQAELKENCVVND
jgi:hypothetical protein